MFHITFKAHLTTDKVMDMHDRSHLLKWTHNTEENGQQYKVGSLVDKNKWALKRNGSKGMICKSDDNVIKMKE